MYDIHENTISFLANKNDYFIYDLDQLKIHAKKIFNSNAKIFFACKANPLSHIISTLNKVGFNFDIASNGELSQILKLGITGNKIILTGPNKSKDLIKISIKNKIQTIAIESQNQLQIVQKLAKQYHHTPNILLRLQLHNWNNIKNNCKNKVTLGGNKVTQFGIDIKTINLLLKNMKLPFLGFQVFQWNNILSTEKINNIWDFTINECQKITKDFQVLDVGGGLGIPYTKNETPILWEKIDKIIKNLKIQYKLKQFWLEMGRYLIGPYGIYITKIIDIKYTYNKKIIILRGGINHLIRSALIGEHFPIELLRQEHSEKTQYYSLHGPLCTTMDFLGLHKLPIDIKIGDFIIIKQVGAYGFTESMPFFLCNNLPGEAIIIKNKITIVRKPITAKQWLK